MFIRSATLTLSTLILALGFATAGSAFAEAPYGLTIAQADDNPAPEGEAPPNPQTLTNPNANKPVTEDEVAECMKSWDPQTGMSKAEYERSCKSTLKYFPEKP